MLIELIVRNLGVIEHAEIVLGASMTALTGETGAGKTMLVEAVSLLMGAKPDPRRVRPGAIQAEVEGRFETHEGDEVILRRVIPATGRARGYVNGQAATVSELSQLGQTLVEICGQHSHQELLSKRSQRQALDEFGSVDTSQVRSLVAQLGALELRRSELGGDERSRARELDLARYQADELDQAQLDDPHEEDALSAEYDELSNAVEYRLSVQAFLEASSSDGGVVELLGSARSLLDRVPSASSLSTRLEQIAIELADIVADARELDEALVADPQRLDEVRTRRQRLLELRRKYGDSIADVMKLRDDLRVRIDELDRYDQTAAAIDQEIAAVTEQLTAERAAVTASRTAAAPHLCRRITDQLSRVGLAGASVEIAVTPGQHDDEVEFLFSANPGMPLRPLADSASGGELSRATLALYLVLSPHVPTVIFDEVDAGVGGEVAITLGRALRDIASSQQVLVVTHLAQIAAQAHAQLNVSKHGGDVTTSVVSVLDEDSRVVELSRMLSGTPHSQAAQQHARELLGASRGADS